MTQIIETGRKDESAAFDQQRGLLTLYSVTETGLKTMGEHAFPTGSKPEPFEIIAEIDKIRRMSNAAEKFLS